MEAKLKNYRQTPRKIRPIAGLLKGMTVPEALAQLDFLAKKSSPDLKRLIASAAANARNNFNFTTDEDLVIDTFEVNQGMSLKRMKPASRGRGMLIRRTRSHLAVSLKPKTKAIKPAVPEVEVKGDKK